MEAKLPSKQIREKMIPGFILLFLVAVTDWVAVAKGWKKVEYIA